MKFNKYMSEVIRSLKKKNSLIDVGKSLIKNNETKIDSKSQIADDSSNPSRIKVNDEDRDQVNQDDILRSIDKISRKKSMLGSKVKNVIKEVNEEEDEHPSNSVSHSSVSEFKLARSSTLRKDSVESKSINCKIKIFTESFDTYETYNKKNKFENAEF